jgi:hypothetical protein
MRAFENVEIGAADAGSANSHQNLAWSRRGSAPVGNGDVAWTVTYQRPHPNPPKAEPLYLMDKKPLAIGQVNLFFI